MGGVNGGGWFTEDSNGKDTNSAAAVACSHIYNLHLVEHIQLHRTLSGLCQYWTMESRSIVRNYIE